MTPSFQTFNPAGPRPLCGFARTLPVGKPSPNHKHRSVIML